MLSISRASASSYIQRAVLCLHEPAMSNRATRTGRLHRVIRATAVRIYRTFLSADAVKTNQ